MLCTVFRRELRVDGLSEAHSFVLHVKNTVVVLEEVNTKVCFARVASGSNLENTVSIAIDYVLMLRDNVGCLIDCKLQVWHHIELLLGATCTPKTYWVKSWLSGTIGFMHDCKEVLHGLLRQ